jgi:hypothetical protein
MSYVVGQGYPCPRVEEVSADGLEMVMERIDGPHMLELAQRQPWRLRTLGRQLRRLHDDLHGLVAPADLRPSPLGPGGSLVHLDLHPLNVIMSARGPVVIDWTNAAAGAPEVDLVATWALLAGGVPEGNWWVKLLTAVGRGELLRGFLPAAQREDLGVRLGAWVDYKSHDTNMTAAEISSMRAVVARYGTRTTS